MINMWMNSELSTKRMVLQLLPIFISLSFLIAVTHWILYLPNEKFKLR